MTDVFELSPEHEQVVFCNDPATGLRAIIALHNTISHVAARYRVPNRRRSRSG